MSDILYSIDKSIFYFVNTTLSNPLFDATMPWLTDWNKSWIGRSIAGVLWLLLMWKGGKKGRIVGLLIVPLIFLSDSLSSKVVKLLFTRTRPCDAVNGIPVMEHIRLLVECGSGYSFPSSHAVNNFAFGIFMSYHYRRWTWAFMLYAFMMGMSRIIVGAHYPSDVLGGAALGAFCACFIIVVWNGMSKKYPLLETNNIRRVHDR